MKKIHEQVKNCKKCEELDFCKKSGMSPSIMTGHKNAKIFFIGQQPSHFQKEEIGISYNEVVFNSRIGKLFYQLFLEKMKLNYNDIYISNCIKCPSRYNISPKEIWADNCFQILQRQIDNLPNLKYIILLGAFVKNYIRNHPLKTNAKVIEIYHASYSWRIGKTEEHMNLLINKLKGKTKEIQS